MSPAGELERGFLAWPALNNSPLACGLSLAAPNTYHLCYNSLIRFCYVTSHCPGSSCRQGIVSLLFIAGSLVPRASGRLEALDYLPDWNLCLQGYGNCKSPPSPSTQHPRVLVQSLRLCHLLQCLQGSRCLQIKSNL